MISHAVLMWNFFWNNRTVSCFVCVGRSYGIRKFRFIYCVSFSSCGWCSSLVLEQEPERTLFLLLCLVFYRSLTNCGFNYGKGSERALVGGVARPCLLLPLLVSCCCGRSPCRRAASTPSHPAYDAWLVRAAVRISVGGFAASPQMADDWTTISIVKKQQLVEAATSKWPRQKKKEQPTTNMQEWRGSSRGASAGRSSLKLRLLAASSSAINERGATRTVAKN